MFHVTPLHFNLYCQIHQFAVGYKDHIVNILHDKRKEQSRIFRQVTADKGQTSRRVLHFTSLNIILKRSQVELPCINEV